MRDGETTQTAAYWGGRIVVFGLGLIGLQIVLEFAVRFAAIYGTQSETKFAVVKSLGSGYIGEVVLIVGAVLLAAAALIARMVRAEADASAALGSTSHSPASPAGSSHHGAPGHGEGRIGEHAAPAIPPPRQS